MKPKGGCEGPLGGCHRLLEELTPHFYVFVSLNKRTETRTKHAHWSLSIGKVASDLKISNAWHKGGCLCVHVHSVHCVINPFGGNWGLMITTKITPLGWFWWWTLDQKYYRGAVTLSQNGKKVWNENLNQKIANAYPLSDDFYFCP